MQRPHGYVQIHMYRDIQNLEDMKVWRSNDRYIWIDVHDAPYSRLEQWNEGRKRRP